MNKQEYSRYLVSKHWLDKRKEALKYWKNSCFICKTKSQLHVHHLHYLSVGKENVKYDLRLLCKFHHDLYHSVYSQATYKNFKRFTDYHKVSYYKPKRRFKHKQPKKKKAGPVRKEQSYKHAIKKQQLEIQSVLRRMQARERSVDKPS